MAPRTSCSTRWSSPRTSMCVTLRAAFGCANRLSCRFVLARTAASPTRAGPGSCAGHSAPRSRRPPTHGTYDMDGAPAPGVWLIASQSAFRSRCERARLISLSARIAAGGCGSSPEPTFGCDATRCDPAHQAAVARWPSHGMSRTSRGRRHCGLAWIRTPCIDARDRAGSSDSPRRTATSASPMSRVRVLPWPASACKHTAPNDRASVQCPRSQCSLHTQARSMAGRLSCLCSG